jgi:hypothetical protein
MDFSVVVEASAAKPATTVQEPTQNKRTAASQILSSLPHINYRQYDVTCLVENQTLATLIFINNLIVLNKRLISRDMIGRLQDSTLRSSSAEVI